jgi:glycosyltransferase involved in cell wall biosynthesis
VGRLPAAVTVHDLSFLVHPECADDGLRRYLERTVPRSVERASVVFAVSQTTASAVTARLGVAPTRIAVVSNAVDQRFRPVPDEARPNLTRDLRAAFEIERGYLLTVGTLEPRKNLVRLLEAYARLRRRWSRRTADGPCPLLVIAGREGWRFEPIFRSVARLGVGKSVRFLTRVHDADLVTLYQGARAFVCASLYEGFGIPPLEAMACGIPVTSSTGGALLEVLGDAALHFEPTDLDAMTDALDRILTDEALRAQLVPAWLARRAFFSWEESARSALAAIEKAAA